jgi:hypothetical protein
MIGPSGGSGPGWYYKGKHYDAPQSLHEAMNAEMNRLELQISEFPKKLLAAVEAEQDRCAKIAEAFWDQADRLNADLRADLTQAEKSMAYMISTNIRALRRRESDFAEKRTCLHVGVFRGEKCGACGEEVR